jgi:hypothetical protein
VNSRTAAIGLTASGAGLLLFLAPGEAATALGSVAALLAAAAIWLTAGRARSILAAGAGLGWLMALVLALFGTPAAVAGCLVGLAGAVIALVRGGSWSGFSSRYARGADVTEDEQISPRQLWESQDRGLDPTRSKDATPDEEGSG